MEALNALIDWKIVIAQAVSFLVLVVVVRVYLFGPINSIIRQRQEQIANSLSGADAQKQQAESLRMEYESRLSSIADEAHSRIEQAMKDAEVARQRIIDQAHGEIRELQDRNQAQLALERERLRRELRADMSDIAVLAATKALRGQLTPTLQSAVVDQVIAELDKQPVQRPV